MAAAHPNCLPKISVHSWGTYIFMVLPGFKFQNSQILSLTAILLVPPFLLCIKHGTQPLSFIPSKTHTHKSAHKKLSFSVADFTESF